jgi:hypothetical protein
MIYAVSANEDIYFAVRKRTGTKIYIILPERIIPMSTIVIFGAVWGAMIATSFWEAYVEGKHAWDSGKLGWKIGFGRYVLLTAYHFYLFCITFPLLLSIPLMVAGYSNILLGTLISAYVSGLMIEDFFWFVANPYWGIGRFNPSHVHWYPWIGFGKAKIPLYYLLCIIGSVASWYLLWR